MRTDTEPEAPPARRLIAFAAVFLGLLAFSNANFSGVPILSPPLVAVISILAAIAGLLIWVNSRWSRGLLWLAAGVALLATAGAALLLVLKPWLGYVLLLLGMSGLVAAVVVAAPLLRPPILERWAGIARWALLVGALGLLLVAAPGGAGPQLGLIAAAGALGCIALLRPQEEE